MPNLHPAQIAARARLTAYIRSQHQQGWRIDIGKYRALDTFVELGTTATPQVPLRSIAQTPITAAWRNPTTNRWVLVEESGFRRNVKDTVAFPPLFSGVLGAIHDGAVSGGQSPWCSLPAPAPGPYGPEAALLLTTQPITSADFPQPGVQDLGDFAYEDEIYTLHAQHGTIHYRPSVSMEERNRTGPSQPLPPSLQIAFANLLFDLKRQLTPPSVPHSPNIHTESLYDWCAYFPFKKGFDGHADLLVWHHNAQIHWYRTENFPSSPTNDYTVKGRFDTHIGKLLDLWIADRDSQESIPCTAVTTPGSNMLNKHFPLPMSYLRGDSKESTPSQLPGDAICKGVLVCAAGTYARWHRPGASGVWEQITAITEAFEPAFQTPGRMRVLTATPDRLRDLSGMIPKLRREIVASAIEL